MPNVPKVRPGEPFRPMASHWNAFVDNLGGGSGGASAIVGSGEQDRVIVRVRNTIAQRLNPGHVIGLGACPISPDNNLSEYKARPILNGETPSTTTHGGRFAVALQDIEAGYNGEALAVGVCAVQVDVLDVNHTAVELADGTTAYLQSSESGSARLLTLPSVEGLQWCLVQLGYPVNSSLAPVRIRLTADLALGGSASAVLLAPSGSGYATGDAITVYDWLNTQPQAVRTGMFRGKAGYEGWAFFRAAGAPDNYDLIWLEHKALFVRFVLTDPITNQNTATAATYSGDTFFQGRDPNAGTGSGVISVYDVEGMFLHAPAGAEGLAVYNDTNDHYEVVICQMPVLKATANLAAPMCGPSAVAIENFSAVVDGLFMLTPDPVPTSVLNPLRRRGISGAQVKIEYDLAKEEWTVYGVETQEFFLGGPAKIVNRELVQDVYSVAAESCDVGPATQHIIGQLTDCDYVPYTPGGGGSGGNGDPGNTDPSSTYFPAGFNLATAPGWSANPAWSASNTFAQTTGAGIGIYRQPSCPAGTQCNYEASLTKEIGPEGGFFEYSWAPGDGWLPANNPIEPTGFAKFDVLVNGSVVSGSGGTGGLAGTDWKTRGPYTLEPGTNVITFRYQERFSDPAATPSGSQLAIKIADLTIWGEVTP